MSNRTNARARLYALIGDIDLLQAGDQARAEGGPDQQLGDFHTDGLIVAARQLVREAHHCLADGDA